MRRKIAALLTVSLVLSALCAVPGRALETEPAARERGRCPHLVIATETRAIEKEASSVTRQTMRTCRMCGQRWLTKIEWPVIHSYGPWRGVSCETAGRAKGEIGDHCWEAICSECGHATRITTTCDGFTHSRPADPPDNTRN